MEPLPKGANFVRSKMLWEIGLHIAGNPLTPYGGNRDMVITVGSGSGENFRPWLRMSTGSAILAEDVAKGNIEMAFVNPSALLTQAVRGVGIFKKPLALRVIAMYPSWDRFVMAVNPKLGIRSLRELKEKRYPLKISVREDPTHSTLVLIDQILGLYGFSLKEVESWGGKLALCGGPGDIRRLNALERGEIDAIFDEGIITWLRQALDAGFVPWELEPDITKKVEALGWRDVVLPKARYPRLDRDYHVIDFSGWPIYASASLPEQMAYDACAAIAARQAEMPWDRDSYTDIGQPGRESDATPFDVPLHPGAERWYRENAKR
jgi:TRAP-type uncharacterized transport system substrate-binding protein